MPITRTPMVDDDGSGTTGTIINNAWKTELYNQIDGVVGAVPPGLAVDQAFSASDYAGTGSMTFTITAAGVAVNAYSVVGQTLTWILNLTPDATLGGTASNMFKIRLPGSRTSNRPVRGRIGFMTSLGGGGGVQAVQFYVDIGSPWLELQRDDGAAFPLGPFYFYAGITLFVN